MRIEQRFRLKPFRTHDPRQFSAHADRIPIRAPVSLASVTVSEITDTMIGLPEDAVAQRRAEQFIRAALSYRQKQADRAEIVAARSTLIASSRRALIKTASPADDADDIGMVPGAVEAVAVGRFQ